MKKSYFIRTFHIAGWLLLISILLFISSLLFEMIGIFLQHQPNKDLIEYAQFLSKYVMIAYQGLQQVFVVSMLFTMTLIIPEITVRIWKDSLINVGKSIWITYRIRKFLKIQASYEEEEIKIIRYNKAINNAIVDVRNTNVVFILKLPNALYIHKMVLDNRDAIRKEISNLLPKYSFSNIQRVKSYIRLEGTKIR